MFESAIRAILGWMTDAVSSLQNSSFLTGGIDSLSSTLYAYIERIYEVVAMPIGLTILAVFLMLELYNISLNMDGAHSAGGVMGMVYRALLKFCLIKFFFDNTKWLLLGLYEISSVMTHNMGKVFTAATTPEIDLITPSEGFFQDLDIGTGLVTCLVALLVYLVVVVIVKLIEIICMARFVQIYFMLAICPIPMAFFPSHEQSQTAKNFLKSFFAVCIQGTAIFLVVSFFPILIQGFSPEGSTSLMDVVFSCAGYVILIGLATFMSGRWAKSAIGAM